MENSQRRKLVGKLVQHNLRKDRTDISYYCIVGRGASGRARLRNVVELPPNVFLKKTKTGGGKKKKKKHPSAPEIKIIYKRNQTVGNLRCHQNPPELDVEGPLPPLPPRFLLD